MPTLFHIYFIPVTLGDVVDILLIATATYGVLSIMEGTRARSMLAGLAIILFGALVAYSLNLSTVAWGIQRLGTVWVIAFLVVFQPELRDILTRIGNNKIFRMFSTEPTMRMIDDLVSSAKILSESQVGALIAIQRHVPLDDIVNTGKPIQAKLTPELLATIFAPHTPLHDGGVIVSGEKIISAACEFPMSENPRYRRILGMRHRAGVGLTEHTDAVVIIVSEETGSISLAIRGYLRRQLTTDALKRLLEVILSGEKVK
ncbi:TIGR00159 family protein [bacterium]|nr:MAG: TIGR00159 family protein [bacterium]